VRETERSRERERMLTIRTEHRFKAMSYKCRTKCSHNNHLKRK